MATAGFFTWASAESADLIWVLNSDAQPKPHCWNAVPKILTSEPHRG
jgi:hypothetical protein